MNCTKIEDIEQEIIELYKKGKLKKEIRSALKIPEATLTKYFRENIVYRFNEDCFEKIDTEEKAYWLGFLWADGYISTGAIFLEISNKDTEHLEKFRNFLGNNYQNFDITKGDCIRLRANSKKIVSDLINLGFGLKDNRINLPKINTEFYKDFIRGYFDGDGHIREKNNLFEGVDISGRAGFIDNLNKLLNFSRFDLHSTNSKRIYSNKELGVKFLNKIYKGSKIYLERKYTCALLYGNM